MLRIYVYRNARLSFVAYQEGECSASSAASYSKISSLAFAKIAYCVLQNFVAVLLASQAADVGVIPDKQAKKAFGKSAGTPAAIFRLAVFASASRGLLRELAARY